MTISLPIDGEDFILDLTLNKQLIPKGFFRKVQKSGTHHIVQPKPEEIDLCHYGGKVRGKTGSWVALSTCDGLSGVVFDGREMHYIEKKDRDWHVLYKHEDLVEGNKTCGYAGDAVDPEKRHSHNRILRVNEETKLKKENFSIWTKNCEKNWSNRGSNLKFLDFDVL